MNKVLILGAFDRYNYGDLLFPLVIKYQLEKKNPDIDIKYFGLIKSDLSDVGGLPTEDIASFYKYCTEGNDKVSIIIAGGESILVTWDSLLTSVNARFNATYKIFKKLRRFISLNDVAKRIAGGKTKLPYTIINSDFKNVEHVIYNSLGGASIKDHAKARFRKEMERMKKVDYFSVRDKETLTKLKAEGINVQLFPDCAIIMSKVYPLSFLEANVSADVKAYVEQYKGKYIFFQTNKGHFATSQNSIEQSLDAAAGKHNLRVCLCPIGKALAHEDQFGLKKLQSALKVPADFFEEVNLWDIMYLIANSACYIGTSLHGAITAMSFKKPYIGIRTKKLDAYIATWGVEGINHTVDFKDIPAAFDVAYNISEKALSDSLDYQFAEIEKSFENMYPLLF